MKSFEYQVIRRDRRKTASIIVQPDRTIKVVVPVHLSEEEISALVNRKSRWIENRLADVDKREQDFKPHTYREGEVFLYLGDGYHLHTPLGNRTEITLNEGCLILPLPPQLPKKAKTHFIRTTLHLWYKRMAREILQQKGEQLSKEHGFSPSSFGIKDYRSRWGCCFTDGRIYFNFKIIAAPPPIIDYVIIHELCHLVQPNHSKHYWQLVERIIPDWRERRKWLKENGYRLEI